jgi:hypothetical protein
MTLMGNWRRFTFRGVKILISGQNLPKSVTWFMWHRFLAIWCMDKVLVQIFLPLTDNNGQPFTREWYISISRELNERFGGVTIYQRAPVTGLWKEEEQDTVKDDLIIYEVMAYNMDITFWEPFKKNLEQQFSQESILIRCYPIQIV